MLAACSGGGGGGGGGGGSRGSLTLSTGTLTFTANGTQTPGSQTVNATVSGVSAETVYLRIVSTGTAVSRIDNILITSNTTGQGTVVPASAATLGPGVHTSTITVTACTSSAQCTSGVIGSPQTIAVTYTISGVAASTAPLAYSIGFNPPAGDLTKSLAVTAHPSFTAASNVNWLSVSPGSGSGGTTQMNVSLVQSVVDTLPSGTHAGTVTLTAPSGQPVPVPVTLAVTKPQLDLAMPYVAGVNQSATVTVRGLYLEQLAGGTVELVANDGSTHALTNLALNPTTLEVTHPALPVGSYAFRMRNAQGATIDRSTARLLVVDNSVYASEFIPWPAGSELHLHFVSSGMFDPERRALRVSGLNGPTTDHYAMFTTEYDTATSSWSPVTVRPYYQLDNVVLSPDGKTLLATSRQAMSGNEFARIAQLSPTTFEEQAALVGPSAYSAYLRLVPLNTNEMMVVLDFPSISASGRPLQRYSLQTNTMTTMRLPADDISGGVIQGRIAGSGNGQRVIAGSSADEGLVYEYTVSDANDLIRSPLYCRTDELDMDRRGDTLLVRGRESLGSFDSFVRVYDRDWNVRGSLPISNYAHVLSPDGSRAYVYEGDGDQLHIYDLTAPLVGGFFPEVQTITLKGDPQSSFASDLPMMLSPDGKVLFLVGNLGIVVQPLP